MGRARLMFKRMDGDDVQEYGGAVLRYPVSSFLFDEHGGPTRCVDDPGALPDRDDHFHYTLVLDLDETLVTARAQGADNDTPCIHVRPYASFLLRGLSGLVSEVEVVVWSAGMRFHVDRCLRILDPDSTLVAHAICRGDSWFNLKEGIVRKTLSALSGGRSTTSIIVDDSVYAAMNRNNAIVVAPFRGDDNEEDVSLLSLLGLSAYVVGAMAAANVGGNGDGDAAREAISGALHAHPQLTTRQFPTVFGTVDALMLLPQPVSAG